MPSQLTLFATIVWVLIHLKICSAQNTYYVSSSTDSACPSTTCLNFSQYIQNSETYFTSNTTFIFSPGDHIVEGNVAIVNVSTLKLIGSNFLDGGKTQILCTLPAAFKLINVSNGEFSALEFISCGEKGYSFAAVSLYQVDKFKLTNCTFQQSRNTALRASKSTAILTRNIFINNSADYIYGGAIYVLNSHIDLQENTMFAYNTAVFGGAIAIRSHSTVNTTGNTVFMRNKATFGGGIYMINSYAAFGGDSYFVENTAEYGSMIIVDNSSLLLTANQTFSKNFADSDGGILVLNARMAMHGQNNFVNNTAEIGGGSAILGKGCEIDITGSTNFIHNSANRTIMTVHDCPRVRFAGTSTLHNNAALFPGIVLILNSTAIFEEHTISTNNYVQNFSSGVFYMEFSKVKFLGNVYFFENRAVIAKHGTLYFNGNINFMNNSGGAGAAAFFYNMIVNFSGNSLFIGNTAEFGGALYLFNSQLSFFGDFIFTENHAGIQGGAIAAVNSSLSFSSDGTFLNNSAMKGGALSLEFNSRFEFLLTVVIQFTENTAQRGGAIHVTDDVRTNECSNNPLLRFAVRLPQCFFKILNESITDNIPLRFENNMASEEGSALYGGRLDMCELDAPLINEHGNTSLSILRALSEFQASNINATLISSAPFRVCFCKENIPNCNYQPPAFSVQRGEIFPISIAALDQINQTIPAIIRSYLSSSVGTHSLNRRDLLEKTSRSCTELHYQVFSEDTSQELILYAEGPCHNVGEAQKSVHLMFRPCPVGFQLSQGECICDRQLQSFTTECNIEDATVTRTNNFWMSPHYSENDTYIGLILHPHCPFDYCLMGTRNVSPSDSDSLCAHNRSGILCSACQQNLSLALGSSRCLKCKNSYLSLIIPLALFGIALVVFLFVLKLTVAIGTINGLIFYANVLAVNRSTFFPSGETNVLTIFIAWLNLDLGIETCFYDGMDTYARVWLQFVFPVYVWMLVGLIILASNLSMRLAKIFGTNPVSVLATLFLLSYGKVLRTIITIMCYTILEYPDGSQVTVWLSDGNITYLTSKHIPLFITALIALLFFFFPYTFLLLLGQCLSPLSNFKGFNWLNNTKFKSFMDAYHAPYTPKCRYWTGLLLLVRLGLFLAFAFNALGESSVNLLLISSTTLGLAMWYILVDRVYSNWYLNTLEFSFIFNLGILSVATLYIGGTGGSQAAATYLSVSIAFTTFLGILFYHIYLQLKDTKVWKTLGKFIRGKTQSSTQKAESGPQPMTVTTTFVELPKSGDSSGYSMTSPSTTTVEMRESVTSGEHPLKSSSTTSVELREPVLDC